MTSRAIHYGINGHDTYPIEDHLAWARAYEQRFDRNAESFDKWRVARTDLPGGGVLSTVFLGIDHAWSGPPLLFETMLFSGELVYSDVLRKHYHRDLEMWRWHTWDEAAAGHQSIVDLIASVDEVAVDAKQPPTGEGGGP